MSGGALLAEIAAPSGEDAFTAVGDRFVARYAAGEIEAATLDAFLAAPGDQAAAMWLGLAATDGDAAAQRRRLDRAIAAIDAALSDQVNAILAHARFSALEAAWRGVSWLVSGLGTDGLSRLRLLDARWAELARDFERATEIEKSTLFDAVYAQEFDMPGGIPFSLLIGLYDVQHRPSAGHRTDDVEILRSMAQVAAAAFAPLILDAAPALFGVDRFGELDLRQTLSADFRSPAYTRFHALQARPDTRFLGVVAPPIRLRGAWRGRSVGDCGFRYEADDRRGLWGPAALAFAHVALRAFNDHRWPAAIRGLVRDERGGGLVDELPVVDFATDAADTAVKFPMEVQLSEALDRELAEAGFIALRRVKDTPFLAFHNMPSLHRPRTVYDTEIARANVQLGAMLNYILCVSRFAHYIKVIGREWIGSFHSAEECEGRLQRWLNRFVSGGDDLSFEQKARFPLQEGRIGVRDIPGQPGAYECTVALKPHFQVDQAISEFQLVTIVKEAGA